MSIKFKFTEKLSALFAVLLTLSLYSCGGDSPELGGGSEGDTSKNSQLNGTKWTSRSFDYDIADDLSWGYVFTDIINIYFHSSTEGVFYQSRKTLDSDTGKSRDTRVCFFKYYVEDGRVRLDNITPETSEFVSYLNYKDGTIGMGDGALLRGNISSSDREWINSINGYTGDCRWYYDAHNTLCVLGKGMMDDYSSYSKTPWGVRDFYLNFVLIGEGVATIGDHAFASPSIGEVEFNKSDLESIGRGAFSDTSIGGKIYLPSSIKEIKEDAFADCGYATFSLPKNIEVIGAGAFGDCKAVNLTDTPHLVEIGDFAFAGTDMLYWTDSENLQVIGNGAVDYPTSSIDLKSIKELGDLAVSGQKLNDIHIGNNLQKVTGTPFYGASSGKIYVNMAEPLRLSNDFVNNAKSWTLYVPKGSESTYKSSPYWQNFKSIIGSDKLDDAGDGNDPDPDEGESIVSNLSVTPRAFSVTISGSISSKAYAENSDYEIRYSTSYNLDKFKSLKIDKMNFNTVVENLMSDSEYFYMVVAKNSAGKVVSTEVMSFSTRKPKSPSSLKYTIDGKTFEFVKVTGLSSGDFYIMQTELPPSSSFVVGDLPSDKIDKNLDQVIIQAEYTDLVLKLRNATDIEFRLPTATEWKYAAVGGEKSKGYIYSGSNNLDDVGWYASNSGKVAHEPAKLLPNELGLYDMSGNFGEVVQQVDKEVGVDGKVYGGCFSNVASKCTTTSYINQPSSGKVGNTTKSEKNAFDARYYTIRLVYSAYE